MVTGLRKMKWNKDRLFQQWSLENWITTYKKNKARKISHTLHKSQVTVNQKPQNGIYIEKNIGRMQQDFKFKGIFSDIMPLGRTTGSILNKWWYIKLESQYRKKKHRLLQSGSYLNVVIYLQSFQQIMVNIKITH